MDGGNEEADDLPDKRAAASMAAFDSLPEAFRRFCAHYPRTAKGQSLASIIRETEGDVGEAMSLMRQLLPVRSEPDGWCSVRTKRRASRPGQARAGAIGIRS